VSSFPDIYQLAFESSKESSGCGTRCLTSAAYARKVGVRTPLLSAAAPIYAAATKKTPSLDTAAVCAVLEKMAGSSVRSSRRDSLTRKSRRSE
jgi:hypothetical protein